MKRIIATIMMGAMTISLMACGTQNASVSNNIDMDSQIVENNGDDNATAGNSGETEANSAQEDEASGTNTDEGNTDETADGNGKTSDSSADGKILVVYFSSANTSDVDMISSATPRDGGAASTELFAQYIHETVGGDIAKITVVNDYPEDYDGTADQAKQERDSDARPEFVLTVNPEDYDTIFVGYPMWWYTLPMIMYTFFDIYDFSGKTIIPFNTHAGSRDGGTYQTIEEFEPNATVLEGLPLSGSSVSSEKDTVAEWLKGLGF